MFEFISSSKIPRLFALAVTLAVSGCVGFAKPYRVVLKELPEKQRIGLLDPVLTTDPEYNEARYSDPGLVGRHLPVQWTVSSEETIERWQEKGVQVKRINASLKKVPAFEFRPMGTDHRKGQKYAYDAREMQNLARSQGVDLLVIPIYQYSNIDDATMILYSNASFTVYCKGVPNTIVRIWYLVVRSNGDIVAATPDFSVPMLFSLSMNRPDPDFSMTCQSVPVENLDFGIPLKQIVVIEDAIR